MADKLTDKQSKFVQEYLIDLNATQAAIRAGYSENTAQVIGSENLSKPIISNAISNARKEHAERCAVTIESLTKELYEAAGMAKELSDPSTLRACIMSVAKIHGLEVNKNEHTGEGGSPIKIANTFNFIPVGNDESN